MKAHVLSQTCNPALQLIPRSQMAAVKGGVMSTLQMVILMYNLTSANGWSSWSNAGSGMFTATNNEGGVGWINTNTGQYFMKYPDPQL